MRISKIFNETLRKIDIYGFVTGFSYTKHSVYKSHFGGVLTLLTFIIGIILFFYICFPVFRHYNPSVYSLSTNRGYYNYHPLNNENFPIAFRFEDETRTAVNETNKLYTYAEAIELKKNETTGMMEKANQTFIKLKDCSESIGEIPEIKDSKGFKCLDFNEQDEFWLGGGLYSEHSIYFKITVFFCTFNGTNCSEYDSLNNFLSGKKKIYLSIWFPDVAIDPLNIQEPLRISYENSLNTLSPLLMKTDRYYYHHTKLKQDAGIIMSVMNDFSGFSFARKETEYQIRTAQDFSDPNKIKTLSTSVFSIDNKENDIFVRYKKLQTQLSDMNSLIKLVTFLFLVVNTFVGQKVMFIKIADEIFNVKFSEKEEEFYKYVTQRKKDFKMLKLDDQPNAKIEFLNSDLNLNNLNDQNNRKSQFLELTNMNKIIKKGEANKAYFDNSNRRRKSFSNEAEDKNWIYSKQRENLFLNTCPNKDEIYENNNKSYSRNNSVRSDNSLAFIKIRENFKKILNTKSSQIGNTKDRNIQNLVQFKNLNKEYKYVNKESHIDYSIFDKSNNDNKLIDVSERKIINLEEDFMDSKKIEKNLKNHKAEIKTDNSNKFIIRSIRNLFDMKSKLYAVLPIKTTNKYVETNFKIYKYIEEHVQEKLDVFFYVKIMFWNKKFLWEDKNKNLLEKEFTIDIDKL